MKIFALALAILFGLVVALALALANRNATQEIRTVIDIIAPPDVVWSVLTDRSDLSWNPFIHRLDGDLVEGASLAITVGLEEDGSMNFEPIVLRVEPNRELRWIGSLLIRGVFDGEHVFRLVPMDDGSTRFQHFELFSGFLVPLFKGKLERDTRPGFEAMNEALKARAEDIARKPTS